MIESAGTAQSDLGPCLHGLKVAVWETQHARPAVTDCPAAARPAWPISCAAGRPFPEGTGLMTRSAAASLLQTHRARHARAGVIGLGYVVGSPLTVEFARAGYPTTGLDLDTPT